MKPVFSDSKMKNFILLTIFKTFPHNFFHKNFIQRQKQFTDYYKLKSI